MHNKTFRRLTAVAAGLSVLSATVAASAQDRPTDPARLALAQRYFDDIQMGKTMQQTFDALTPAMSAQMTQELGGQLTPAQAAAMSAATTETMAGMMKSMTDKMQGVMVPIVAQVFSLQELTDLVAFYESPTGKSMVAKSPQLSAALASHFAEFAPDSNAISQELMRRFCEKTDCNALPKGTRAGQGA